MFLLEHQLVTEDQRKRKSQTMEHNRLFTHFG